MPASSSQIIQQALQLQCAGRLDEAEPLYRQVLDRDPRASDAWHLWGMIAFQRNEPMLAVERIEQALRLRPREPIYHSNLGLALHAAGRVEEALSHFRQAIKLSPSYSDAHNNLGVALREEGRLDEAIAAYRQALKLSPDDVSRLDNLAVALREAGQLDEAQTLWDRAMQLRPDDPELHFNRSLAFLLAGDYGRGWAEYEWRWQSKHSIGLRRHGEIPRWRGEDLAGRTLLLHGEQGYGDALQFIRYAPLVKARGATVVLECERPLMRLLSGAQGVDQVIALGEPLPKVDFVSPLMSLPGVMGSTLETIPSARGYLTVPATAAMRWAQPWSDAPALRIGLAWQGNPRHLRDQFRSIPLAKFASVARVPGVRLYSLQKGPGREQLATAGFPIEDLSEQITDFADSAAVVAKLDLVISCDSVPAHLAGALGRPAWVVLPFSPDWRWLLGRSDSPWYESLRLFRQRKLGDWTGVLAEVEAAVAELAARSKT